MPQIDFVRLSTIALVLCLGWASARAEEAPVPQSPSPPVSGSTPDPGQREPAMPQREKDLIGVFARARKQYISGRSGTFAKDVRVGMQLGVVAFMEKGQDADDWIGTVKTHGTTPEGDVWLTLEIADGVTVSTWQTGVADKDERTLMPPYSPLHDLAQGAEIGKQAVFSGKILGSLITNDDEMISRPQLIMRFTALRIIE